MRQICDFLFYCLMTNDTLDAGEVGAVPSSLGQLEIEAKIGTLIDRQTGARLQLPVRTESVIADGMDISFVSDMTMVSLTSLVHSPAVLGPLTRYDLGSTSQDERIS